MSKLFSVLSLVMILILSQICLADTEVLSPDPAPKLIVGVKGATYYYDPNVYYVDENGDLRDSATGELEWQNHVTDSFDEYQTNCIDVDDQGWTINSPTDVTVFTYLTDVEIHLVASNCDVSPTLEGQASDYTQEPTPPEQADGYLPSYFIWNLGSISSPGWTFSFTHGGKDYSEYTGQITSSNDCELWSFADYTGDHLYTSQFYTSQYYVEGEPDHEPFTPKSANSTYCFGRIPTLTEWGLIIFGVVLVGFITWVFLKRRKVIGVRSKV